LTIRTALLLGFGLTFGVWLFAGYYFAKRFGEIERRAGTIKRAHAERLGDTDLIRGVRRWRRSPRFSARRSPR
jgi:hypothetical protein